ncbi:MAG: hypothetical protein KC656_08650 [Myxococcales bacterium]|nr:hypothetical protein [Myxococcales bacterium]
MLLLSTALAWPDAWVSPVPAGPLALEGAGDAASGDLIGRMAFGGDAGALYVRMELAAPADAAQAHGVLLELDGDAVIDLLVLFEPGVGLLARENAEGAPGTQLPFTAYGPPAVIAPVADGRRLVADGTRSFVDLALPRAALLDLGVTDTTPIRSIAVTGTSVYAPFLDVGGCPGLVASVCPTPVGSFEGPLRIDADGDGWTGPEELLAGSSPVDADSDDDGVPDGEESLEDSDGDGLADVLDCDSDDDGLLDGVEAGIVTLLPDTALTGCVRLDADPTSTTDPTAVDSDGGGLPDGAEDRDGDGMVDPWETDPGAPGDDLDTDGDGIADALELQGPDGSVDDDDSDGDGAPDAVEGLDDADGDGWPAFLDDDSDGDGVPDADQGAGDLDGDGLSDTSDPDVDGDGIPNAVEGTVDSDGDGIPDLRDTDSDDDGVPDAREGVADPDGDGVPAYLDDDSDGDGLTDADEGAGDTDGDGIPDVLETDSDGDGLSDGYEGLSDPDLDGLPCFRDLNCDGAGPTDAVEGTGDRDCDGIPDFRDRDDEDGFCDPPGPVPIVAPPPAPIVIEQPIGGCATGGTGGWVHALGRLVTRRP